MLAKVRDVLVTNTLMDGGTVALRIATVCSGIDSPIFALHELMEAATRLRCGPLFELQHVFACEVENWKQVFLMRNSNPDCVYRDIMELSKPGATDAYVPPPSPRPNLATVPH